MILTILERARRVFVWVFLAVFLTSIVTYFTFQQWIGFFIHRILQGNHHSQFIVTTLFEGFSLRIKLSLMLALAILTPFMVILGVTSFIKRLTTHVRRLVYLGVTCSFLLGIGAFYLTYYRLIPLSVKVLTAKAFIPDSVRLMLNFNQTMGYVVLFLLVSIVVFQFPIVLMVLLHLNVLKRAALVRSWRFVIVAIVIVSAVVTPTPDVMNQSAIAVPMIVLYGLTVLVAKLFHLGEG